MKRSLFLLAVIAAVVALAPKASYAHRYFDAWAARWTTPDPALNENPQVLMKKYGYTLFETAPYVYTHDNPLRYADPNGKRGFDMIGGPIIVSTSWKEFEYRFIGTAAEGAAVAALYFAPELTTKAVQWMLANPATTAAVSTAAVQALMPGTEGIGINVGTADFAVIGPYEASGGGKSYVDVAKELGASFFSVGKDEAEQLGPKGIEEANLKFLDWGAKQGMEFKLSASLDKLGDKSFTRQEINYLQKQYGYSWNEGKTALVAPQK